MPDEEEEVLAELLTEDEIRRRNAANRRKRGMMIKTAIRLLEQEYERAKGLDFVHDPTAYALYQVWKMAERGTYNA